MNFLIQKLKNLDPNIMAICFFFGVIVGWTLHYSVMRNYVSADCLLTRQQVIENLDRQGYKNGPVSICLQFEEFKK